MRVPPHSASVNIRKQVWYPPALARCQEYSEFPYKILVTASHVAPPPLVAPRRPRGTSSGAGIFEFGALRGPRRAGGGRERHRRARLPWGDVVAEFGRRRRRPRVDVRAHPSCGGGAAGGSAGATRRRPRGPLLRPAAGSSGHVDGRRELVGLLTAIGDDPSTAAGRGNADCRPQVRVPHPMPFGRDPLRGSRSGFLDTPWGTPQPERRPRRGRGRAPPGRPGPPGRGASGEPRGVGGRRLQGPGGPGTCPVHPLKRAQKVARGPISL